MKKPSSRRGPSLGLLAGITLLVFTTAACMETHQAEAKKRSASSGSDDVVATFKGEKITREELTEEAFGRTLQQRQQIYQTELQILDQMIEDVLLEREAKRRGISEEKLIEQEIEAKIQPVTDEQVEAWYNANKNRVRGAPLNDQLKQTIRQRVLEPQARQQARDAFFDPLKEKADVSIMLDPPRVPVKADNDPSVGPADAPVTIVEFSDFQ